MNDHPFYIETEEEKRFKKRQSPSLPVGWQILSLLVILGGIFYGLLNSEIRAVFFNDEPNTTITTPPPEISNSNFAPAVVSDLAEVSILAKSALVFDTKDQRVLYEKNAEKALPLASITKLMTALLAYELVSDDTLVTLSAEALSQENSGDLRAGETFKIKELTDFTLVASYNGAAYALAERVGQELGGDNPTASFVAGMNVKAKELDLKSLEFLNPTGLDVSETKAGAVGSAKDVTLLMEYIIKNFPEILEPTIFDISEVRNTNGQLHRAKNTNNLVGRIPNLIGSKTGFTDLAGGNLTIAMNIGLDRVIIITVLGSSPTDRFSDMEKLVNLVQTAYGENVAREEEITL